MGDFEGSSKYISKARLENLVDGIFAIAMTLLVLGLAVPQIEGPVTAIAVQNSLYHLLPLFISMVLSFIMLAIFWNIHHRIYSQIKVVNGTLLWINIIWLLFIVLVPFSASLSGQYGDFTIVKVIFNINMLGIALLLYLNAYILNRSNFIDEKGDRTKLISSLNSSLIFRLIALLALLLAFIIPA